MPEKKLELKAMYTTLWPTVQSSVLLSDSDHICIHFFNYVYVHFSDFVFRLGSQGVMPYQLPPPQCTGAPIRLLEYTQPATTYVSSVVDSRCRDDSENINVACAMEL